MNKETINKKKRINDMKAQKKKKKKNGMFSMYHANGNVKPYHA